MGVVSSRFSRRLFGVCRWRLLCFSMAALDLCVFRISSTFDFKLSSSCTGHTLQALLCDHMCSPHCNKALHVLKFTKYFTNGQCSFFWYFILNSTTSHKITGKEIAWIQTTTDKIQSSLYYQYWWMPHCPNA